VLTEDFHDYQIRMVQELCPPFDAVGIGGSAGMGQQDADSDRDFFLLAPADRFLPLVESFPRLVRHAWPPIVERRRGFVAEFGYMYTYMYDNGCYVDYILNCSGTLPRTPMVAKIRVLKDLTGEFTAYREEGGALARDFPNSAAAESASADLLIETRKIKAYAVRAELISVLHCFERFRLVLLALDRHLRGTDPYTPHDAAKWVARDLPDLQKSLSVTFVPFSWEAAESAFAVLQQGIRDRLVAVGGPDGPGPAYWRLFDAVACDVRQAMRQNARLAVRS
jgi:hypothetical protein